LTIIYYPKYSRLKSSSQHSNS